MTNRLECSDADICILREGFDLDDESDRDGTILAAAIQVFQQCSHNISAQDLINEYEAFSFNARLTETINVNSLQRFQTEVVPKLLQLPTVKVEQEISDVPATTVIPLIHKPSRSLQQQLHDISIPNVQTEKSHNFSPMKPKAISASSGPSYSNRSDRGRQIASINANRLKEASPVFNSNRIDIRCQMSRWVNANEPFRYMFEEAKCGKNVIDDRIDAILSSILDSLPPDALHSDQADADRLTLLTLPSLHESLQTSSIVGGMICSQSNSNGKLHSKDIALYYQGVKVAVNIDECSAYSIFPGQIVALQGFNPTGRIFIATQIYTPTCPTKLHQAPAVKVEEQLELIVPETQDLSDESSTGPPVSLMVACGPFFFPNDSSLAPLHDLMAEVSSRSPHALILCGPFIDSSTLHEPHKDLFPHLMDIIYNAIFPLPTHVILVPSLKDFLHCPIFPQPPFNHQPDIFSHDTISARYSDRIISAPNPSIIKCGHVNVAVSTQDILFHLAGRELSHYPPEVAQHRIVSLARHVLQQGSFYPLYPAQEFASVDMQHSDKLTFDQISPDLLVLPSQLAPFVHRLSPEDVVCINPSFLTRGMSSGGTFAAVAVYPPSTSAMSSPESVLLNQRTRVDIIRI